MEQVINTRIKLLFQGTLDKIKKQSNCKHDWYRSGEACYQCTKCDYLADDLELDNMIFKDKTKHLLR